MVVPATRACASLCCEYCVGAVDSQWIGAEVGDEGMSQSDQNLRDASLFHEFRYNIEGLLRILADSILSLDTNQSIVGAEPGFKKCIR